MLSGYRLMWMLVMFDLPVMTEGQRKSATKFRQFLLDQGFEMAQYSVYMRYCAGKEQVEAQVRSIRRNLPRHGQISILSFTDKQYEQMVHFDGAAAHRRKMPDQLALF